MKETIRACINSIRIGEASPPRSWMGGLICFLLKKDAVLDIPGYHPVCLLDTVYKILSAIITDRLYRLAERHGLLDSSQEGFRRLHSTQLQVQSLHWAIQEAAEWGKTLFCCYLEFAFQGNLPAKGGRAPGPGASGPSSWGPVRGGRGNAGWCAS